MATKIKLRRLLALHLTGPIAKPFENNEIGIQKSKNPFADKLLDREIEIGSIEEKTVLAAIINFNITFSDTLHLRGFNLDETIRILFKNLPLPADSLENVINEFFDLVVHHQLNPLSNRNNDEEAVLLEEFDEDEISTSVQTKLNNELRQIAIERQQKILNHLSDPELPPVRRENIDDLKINLGYLSEAEYSDFLCYLFIDPSISIDKTKKFITEKSLDGILSDEKLKTAIDNKPKTKQGIKESLQSLLGIGNEELETLTNNIHIQNLRNLIQTKLSTYDHRIKLIDIIKLVAEQNIELDNVLKEKSIDEINNFTNDLIAIRINTPLATIQNTIKNFFGRDSKFYKTKGENLAIDIFVSQKLNKLKNEDGYKDLYDVLENEKPTIRGYIKNGLDFSEEIKKLKQPSVTKEKLKKSLTSATQQQIDNIFGLNQYLFLIQQLEGQIPNSLINILKLDVNKNAIISMLANLEHAVIKEQVTVLTNQTESLDNIKQAFQQLTGAPQPDVSEFLKHFHEVKQAIEVSLQYFTNGRPILKELLEQANNNLITLDTVEKLIDAKKSFEVLAGANNQDIEDMLEKLGIGNTEENTKLVTAENRLYVLLRSGTLRTDIKTLLEQNLNSTVKKIAGADPDFIQGNLTQITQLQTGLPNLIRALETLGIPEAENEAHKIYSKNQFEKLLENINKDAPEKLHSPHLKVFLNKYRTEIEKFIKQNINVDYQTNIVDIITKGIDKGNNTPVKTCIEGLGIRDAARIATYVSSINNLDSNLRTIRQAYLNLDVPDYANEALAFYGKRQLSLLTEKLRNNNTLSRVFNFFNNNYASPNNTQLELALTKYTPNEIETYIQELEKSSNDTKTFLEYLQFLFPPAEKKQLQKLATELAVHHQYSEFKNQVAILDIKKITDSINDPEIQETIEKHFIEKNATVISLHELLDALSKVNDVIEKARPEEAEENGDEVQRIDSKKTAEQIKAVLAEKLGSDFAGIDDASLIQLRNVSKDKNKLQATGKQALINILRLDAPTLTEWLTSSEITSNFDPAVTAKEILAATNEEALEQALNKLGIKPDKELEKMQAAKELFFAALAKSTALKKRADVIQILKENHSITLHADINKLANDLKALASHYSDVQLIFEILTRKFGYVFDPNSNEKTIEEQTKATRTTFYKIFASNLLEWMTSNSTDVQLTLRDLIETKRNEITSHIIQEAANGGEKANPEYWKDLYYAASSAQTEQQLEACYKALGITEYTATVKNAALLDIKKRFDTPLEHLKQENFLLYSIITQQPELKSQALLVMDEWSANEISIRTASLFKQLGQTEIAGANTVVDILKYGKNSITEEQRQDPNTPKRGLLPNLANQLSIEQQKLIIGSSFIINHLKPKQPILYKLLSSNEHAFKSVAKKFGELDPIARQNILDNTFLEKLKNTPDIQSARHLLQSTFGLNDRDISSISDKEIKATIGELRIPVIFKHWLEQNYDNWHEAALCLGSMTSAKAKELCDKKLSTISDLPKANHNKMVSLLKQQNDNNPGILENILLRGSQHAKGLSQIDADKIHFSARILGNIDRINKEPESAAQFIQAIQTTIDSFSKKQFHETVKFKGGLEINEYKGNVASNSSWEEEQTKRRSLDEHIRHYLRICKSSSVNANQVSWHQEQIAGLQKIQKDLHHSVLELKKLQEIYQEFATQLDTASQNPELSEKQKITLRKQAQNFEEQIISGVPNSNNYTISKTINIYEKRLTEIAEALDEQRHKLTQAKEAKALKEITIPSGFKYHHPGNKLPLIFNDGLEFHNKKSGILDSLVRHYDPSQNNTVGADNGINNTQQIKVTNTSKVMYYKEMMSSNNTAELLIFSASDRNVRVESIPTDPLARQHALLEIALEIDRKMNSANYTNLVFTGVSGQGSNHLTQNELGYVYALVFKLNELRNESRSKQGLFERAIVNASNFVPEEVYKSLLSTPTSCRKQFKKEVEKVWGETQKNSQTGGRLLSVIESISRPKNQVVIKQSIGAITDSLQKDTENLSRGIATRTRPGRSSP